MVLIALLVAVFWPLELATADPTSDSHASGQRKLQTLINAIHHGRPAEARFDEAEINAHLAAILARHPEVREARGLTVAIDRLRFVAHGRGGTFYLLGRLAFVPIQVAVELADTTRDDDAHDGTLPVDGVRLGRLPMVWPLEAVLIGRLESLFSGCRDEQAVLDRLDHLDFEPGEVTLTLDPSKGESSVR